MNDDPPPTIVSFAVKKGDVWISPDNVAWYVASVGTGNTVLERTVHETVPTRDLVRCYRQMNETHPLHPK